MPSGNSIVLDKHQFIPPRLNKPELVLLPLKSYFTSMEVVFHFYGSVHEIHGIQLHFHGNTGIPWK